MERRLAAILAADVVGYTRLMGVDEAGTLARLKALRTELVQPEIANHKGRVFKVMGDGLLAEFQSAVEAVQCAVDIQRTMVEREKELEDGLPIRLRIGLNLGDIIVEESDVYGDGVNIATRLEGLADPGGVCISNAVNEQIEGRISVAFDDAGDQAIKNVDRLIHAWKWRPVGDYVIANVSQPVPGFGGRPAIAVLAFNNLSPDPEQEFLADGLAEDIITRLAMWRWLPVIARNSSFTFKDQTIDLKKVGAELGARYVLEGSVRKIGAQLRITGQLIDTETGHHVWADRYDRTLDDFFAVQDEITDAIVAALEPAVGRAEMHRAHRKDPRNLDAWSYYQRGMWLLNKISRQDIKNAQEMLSRSAIADPNFAPSHAGLALLGYLEVSMGFTTDRGASTISARESALNAARLDELDPFSQAALGYTSFMIGEHDAAIACAERSVELNPSYALGYHCLHTTLFMVGRFDESLVAVERACRISPSDPWLFYFMGGISACHYMLRQYLPAIDKAKISVERQPQYPSSYRWLASALAQSGQVEEAQKALARFVELSPDARVAARHSYPFRNRNDLSHYLDGLQKAGL